MTAMCDLCGEGAVYQEIDSKPAQPVRDAQGRLYSTRRPLGRARSYCEAHKPKEEEAEVGQRDGVV